MSRCRKSWRIVKSAALLWLTGCATGPTSNNTGSADRLADEVDRDVRDDRNHRPQQIDADAIPTGLARCPLQQTMKVKLRADRPHYKAIWRRCRQQRAADAEPSADLKTSSSPIDLLLIVVPETGKTVLAFSNHRDPGLAALDRLEVLDLRGDGTRQLLVEEMLYGSGPGWRRCVVGTRGPTIDFWSLPDLRAPTRTHLASGEWLCAGWQLAVVGRTLQLETPVFAKHDACCCPSRGLLRADLQADTRAPRLVVKRFERVARGPGSPARRSVK